MRERPALQVPAPRRPDRRGAILAAALREFAANGYSGARIERIAAAAGVNDRLIYYYFGSKEALYLLTVENAYEDLNRAEGKLALGSLPPREALAQVVKFTWRYYLEHPEFITLLNTENLHRGRNIRKSSRVRGLSRPVIAILDSILRRGRRAGEFRRDATTRQVYLAIAALGYFYLSNRHTLSNFLGVDLAAPRQVREWEAFIVDAVQRVAGPGRPGAG
jgi:AcrR family transcriptional regulator